MSSLWLKLFSYCVPVKGRRRSIICDLQREKLKFIPNSMYGIIKELEKTSLDNFISVHNVDETIFKEYIDFLIGEGFAFHTTQPDKFPQLNLDYASPEIISNSLIEYDFNTYSIQSVLEQLDELLCKHIEIRLCRMNNSLFKEMHTIIKILNNKTFRSVAIIFPFYEGVSIEGLKDLYEENKKIDAIILYNSFRKYFLDDARIFFTTDDLASKSMIEGFPKDKIIINIDYFSEAQKFNPYYNKKVCINKFGEIKNCLLHTNNFGNVNMVSLSNIVSHIQFQNLWHASHDKIRGIKDSELRYNILITDNLIQRSENDFIIDGDLIENENI